MVTIGQGTKSCDLRYCKMLFSFLGLRAVRGVLPSAGVDESFSGLGAEDELDTLFGSLANSFQALLSSGSAPVLLCDFSVLSSGYGWTRSTKV